MTTMTTIVIEITTISNDSNS